MDIQDKITTALEALGAEQPLPIDIEHRAESAMLLGGGRTVEQLIEFAVINLRAAQLLQEREKEMDGAFALYSLAYPDAMISREEFPGQSMHSHWIMVLRKIRRDPTVLGAL